MTEWVGMLFWLAVAFCLAAGALKRLFPHIPRHDRHVALWWIALMIGAVVQAVRWGGR